jgi:hypothetical protein
MAKTIRKLIFGSPVKNCDSPDIARPFNAERLLSWRIRAIARPGRHPNR